MSYRVSRITDPFTIRLPKPVIKAIELIAAQEGVTRNDVAKRFIVAGVGRIEISQAESLGEKKGAKSAVPVSN